MAAYLAYGVQEKPNQSPQVFNEYVKHFESNISFGDLQDQINDFLALLGSDIILNRPSIKNIEFEVFMKDPPMATIIYFAQVHYLLTGDNDDSPNIP
jgi:hypothetical protein